jgi:hypothetical protein
MNLVDRGVVVQIVEEEFEYFLSNNRYKVVALYENDSALL